MGMHIVDKHDAFKLRRTVGIFDDFLWAITAHQWTTLVADGGSVAVGDAANGVVVLTTGGTDNNEVALKTTAEVFKVLADKPLMAECKLKYTEANTDDANIYFGFADALGADMMVDNGAGPKVSYSGAGFYKVDGGTAWKVITSLGTTQQISTTAIVPGGGVWQTLKVEVRMVDATQAEATFWIDDQQCLDAVTLKPIKHVFTYTSATEMQLGWAVKAGGSNAEVVNVDYVGAEALR